MGDLVERLKEWAGSYEEGSFDTEESLMSEAATEIEKLRRERDILKAAIDQLHGPLSIAALEARATSAEAKVAEMREALKPFAKYQTGDDAPDWMRIPDSHAILFNGLGDNCQVVVTVGDFRRARALADGGAHG